MQHMGHLVRNQIGSYTQEEACLRAGRLPNSAAAKAARPAGVIMEPAKPFVILKLEDCSIASWNVCGATPVDCHYFGDEFLQGRTSGRTTARRGELSGMMP